MSSTDRAPACALPDRATRRPISPIETLKRIGRAVRYTRPGVEPTTSHGSIAVQFVRCLTQFPRLRAWFADTGNPALHEALAHRPSLITCVGRPYVHVGWPAARKLDIVRDHYQLLSDEFGWLRFDPGGQVVLAQLGEGLSLRIDKAPWFEHEGELTLSLFGEATRLYSIVFTLGRSEHRRIACVGALQGLGSPEALEIYRLLTRRLHGLRPRDLMITSFRQLCSALGVVRIFAVTDNASVSRSAYFKDAVKLHASYDQAWAENGGLLETEGPWRGFCSLDPVFTPRPADDIPTRKRALYRRRYELLAELGQQIEANIPPPLLGPARHLRARDPLPANPSTADYLT